MFALFKELVDAMNTYLIYSANNEVLLRLNDRDLEEKYWIDEAGYGSFDISHISKKDKAMGVRLVLIGTEVLDARNDLIGAGAYVYNDNSETILEYNPRVTSIKSYNNGRGKMNIFGIGGQAYSSHKYSVNFNRGTTLKLMFRTK